MINQASPCANIRGHLVPLDRLPADLRRRWDLGVLKRDHANANISQQGKGELAKVADDIVAAIGPELLLKAAAPRRSIFKIGR